MPKIHHKKTLALGMLLALVAGSAAGIVASVRVQRSLEEYAASLFTSRSPAVPDGRMTRATPTSYEGALERVRTTAAKSVAAILPLSLDARTASSWVTEDDATGYGVVVSTDGWVLVAKDTLASFANPLRQAEVWIDGVRYTPTKIVADTLSDAVLLHVDANGLSPAGFGASKDVVNGEVLYIASGTQSLMVTSLVNGRFVNGAPVLPAEMYVTSWSVATNPEKSSPVFDAAGEVLAMSEKTAAFPMHTATAFVNDVLRTGGVQYAGLGAYVVDLSLPLNVDDALRQGKHEGALLTTAPLYKSPASNDLLAGDIIVSVGDVRIDATTSLSDILRSYEPGQSAIFSVLRSGEIRNTTVTLGDYESLLY